MKHALEILAGPRARQILAERGFRAADVDVVVGASGGPKWQVLAGLDEVLFPLLRDSQRSGSRRRPLQLIGSSIGSWRMACLARQDPARAIERFENIYLQQRYSSHPSPDEVSRVAAGLLDALIDEQALQEITDTPWAKLNVITARCHGLIASEKRGVQFVGLAIAALANAVSRKTLGWQVERFIFSQSPAENPFGQLADQPTRVAALTSENLKPALLASGAIPLVFNGKRIPEAPAGIYRDGGIVDYHPDFDFGPGDGLVLYPHFYPEVIPGWFDKKLRRRARGEHFDRVLLLSPSREFVAQLPGGKIPDRKDFYRYENAERERIWRGVMDASRQLGDEFMELVENGAWEERLQSF